MGKATFNPFSVTRKIDRVSPQLHQMCCSGTLFKNVDLLLRKSGGGPTSGVFAAFGLGLAAIRSIAWTDGDDAPREVVTFEYGSLSLAYAAQRPDGSVGAFDIKGWDRVKNVQLTT